LFDASHNVIESLARYGRDLQAQDFQANGIAIIITDGDDNASVMTPNEVKKAVAEAMQKESLESIRTILVGVNTNGGSLSTYLQNFKNQVGFDQYIDIGTADARSLAKLADFVSKSISSQSQSLGTGGPSKALTF
jgi:Mg-chelatase subunit ChlD